ncbi:hypothetical protein KGF57_002390 [Candida theae]|uniref:Uncharacterized protein n=1 Tax=Candida theae TaxID=1198502 RepID=A0AAD5BEX2_9ASCO|nr:uncharacterized protein KGF57_002390 [Candida theae]KAI5958545.1 hypothetical protein KGF57_002390 [Candida theae]
MKFTVLRSVSVVWIFAAEVCASAVIGEASFGNSVLVERADEDEHHHHEHAAANSTITDCHMHGDTQYCIDWEGNEGRIEPSQESPQSNYTGCHSHGTEVYCMNGEEELQFVVLEESSEANATASQSSSASQSSASSPGSSSTTSNGNSATTAGGTTVCMLLFSAVVLYCL